MWILNEAFHFIILFVIIMLKTSVVLIMTLLFGLFVNLRESAMLMNSMYPDGWFAFGAAALMVVSLRFVYHLFVFEPLDLAKIYNHC